MLRQLSMRSKTMSCPVLQRTIASKTLMRPAAVLSYPSIPRMTETVVSSNTRMGFSTIDIADDVEALAASPNRTYQFFRDVEVTPEGVAIISFDNPEKSVNTISFALKDEAKKLWTNEIEGNDAVRAVVFSSAKPNGFIAGADIGDIRDVEDKNKLGDMIADGMEFFGRMKSSGIPLVCAIHGPALGGGLEWALWCDYRICTDSPKTKMGLPEVKLGLLPGFGGTQNLTALVGVQNALDAMLTGKDIRPAKAKKMGLVDLVVSPESLMTAAVDAAARLAEQGVSKSSKKSKKSWKDWFIEDTAPGRAVLWRTVEKEVTKNTAGKYPAPFAIIDSVRRGLDDSKSQALKTERDHFIRLAQTPESEALIGIFDGMTAAKKIDARYGGDNADVRPVETVAVIGAGLMGAGIAQVSAEKAGVSRVLLKDRTAANVSKGQSYLETNWNKKVKKRRMTAHEYNLCTSRVVGLDDSSSSTDRHLKNADLVIEAVFEDIGLKKRILADMESRTPDHCIFATNTSAIPIADIAAEAKRPSQVVGMHYFSPVPSMPLLEIIPHEGTSDETIATACQVGTKQGKTCVVVKDVPGFYVNRCLGPYMVEATALVRDGVDLNRLDVLLKDFGMPVGPITLVDEVGIDVGSHVFQFLSDADMGVRMHGGDISVLAGMVERQWLGKKTGKGFYVYDNTKKSSGGKMTIDPEVRKYLDGFISSSNDSLSNDEIVDRMVCRLVNEAAKCLEDDIVSDPQMGDISMVFGIGFAPFRGGPFRYLDQRGVVPTVRRMEELAERYGPQFGPCQLLQDYAAADRKFHP